MLLRGEGEEYQHTLERLERWHCDTAQVPDQPADGCRGVRGLGIEVAGGCLTHWPGSVPLDDKARSWVQCCSFIEQRYSIVGASLLAMVFRATHLLSKYASSFTTIASKSNRRTAAPTELEIA